MAKRLRWVPGSAGSQVRYAGFGVSQKNAQEFLARIAGNPDYADPDIPLAGTEGSASFCH